MEARNKMKLLPLLPNLQPSQAATPKGENASSSCSQRAAALYGNIGELAFVRAQHSGDARVEAAQALYDPESPVAGGGAEEFRKRRKAYFEGMAAAGRTKEEVLKELARDSIPFASVGLGYCGGRREILKKDGTKEVPPCLGSLECQPKYCKQAVITKAHAPHWQRVLDQNTESCKRRAPRPRPRPSPASS